MTAAGVASVVGVWILLGVAGCLVWAMARAAVGLPHLADVGEPPNVPRPALCDCSVCAGIDADPLCSAGVIAEMDLQLRAMGDAS